MLKRLVIIGAVVLLAALLSVGISAEDKITLVLDPGHGGHDPGTTVGTRYESDYNYDVALLLKGYLEETGKFNVILSRERSEYKKYLARALVAEQAGADMLISLHFNSNTALDPTLNGVEVLASVLDEWSPDALSAGICSAISSQCGLQNGGVIKKTDTGDSRGVYYWNEEIGWDVPGVAAARVSDYYSMISWGTKLGFPSIIVEHAYLSNASDLAFCDSADGLQRMARAEADAIISYFTGHTHTYVESCDRKANCCLGGVYSQKCTICGHRQNVRRTNTNPYVHAWTTETVPVTCTTNGAVNRECQISRNLSEKGLDYLAVHTQSEIIYSAGHSYYVETDTPASHGVDGIHREICSVCGDVSEIVTPGDPHVYNVIESVPVTCTADGHTTYVCTVCDHTYTDTFASPGHSYFADGEALRCDSDGTKEYVCSVCGDVMSEDVQVPPHTFETVEEIPSDSENEGKTVRRCSVCGFEETEIVPKTESVDTDKADVNEPEKASSKDKSDKGDEKPHVLPIVIAVSASVAVLAVVAILFLKAGKRRIAEIAEESAALMEEYSRGLVTEDEKTPEKLEADDIKLDFGKTDDKTEINFSEEIKLK